MEISDAIKTAGAWDAFGLHSIPDDDLAEAFTLALERLEQDQTFGAINIRDAWNSIRRNRAEAESFDRQGKALRYQETGITFAQWFDQDRAWVEKNLPPGTAAQMQETFNARTGGEPPDPSPPPSKDCFVHPPAEASRYCRKCAQLSGVYWDPDRGKFRCCECDGGRDKAAGIWKRKR